MRSYDIAQVCTNGHVTNNSTQRNPEFSMRFCDKCGEETITKCLSCSSQIRGDYHVEGVFAVSRYSPPSYCQIVDLSSHRQIGKFKLR